MAAALTPGGRARVKDIGVEHANTRDRPAFLFSFIDAPVMKALDLYREAAKA
jgi:gentisate 1,2-dioxygenase